MPIQGRMTNDDFDAQVKRAVAEVKALCADELMPVEQQLEFLRSVVDALAEFSDALDEIEIDFNDC